MKQTPIERFREKFGFKKEVYSENFRDGIEKFWMNELSTLLSQVEEAVSDKEKVLKKRYGIMEEDGQDRELGYNEAITEVLSSIAKIKESYTKE